MVWIFSFTAFAAQEMGRTGCMFLGTLKVSDDFISRPSHATVSKVLVKQHPQVETKASFQSHWTEVKSTEFFSRG